MPKSVIFMFSGQGSQYYHMGKELFERHAVFQKWMKRLDGISRDIIGESVLDQLYDENKGKGEIFDRTLYTHPAIFMVEYALAQVLLESGIEPDYVLGTSLGEFASASLAGVMEVENLAEALIEQAKSFEAHCEKGGLLAILDDIRLYNETPLLYENGELASVNYDSHFVVSGKAEKLKDIESFLKNKGIPYQALPVSHGFHSSYIDPAASVYKKFLSHKHKSCQPPRIPFISCLYGTSIQDIPADYLWEVVRKPIQFPRAIQELEKGQDSIYLDLGPGGTLASFTKRNLTEGSKSDSYVVMTQFHQDLKNLDKVKEQFPKKNFFSVERKVKNMMTYVFPGQGSQSKGMGGTLFDEFKELTAQADTILGYSIRELCTEDPSLKLNQTQYTQPVLFIVNAFSYFRRIKETGKKPDYVAGHSLGEYDALFAAGAFDFETGVKLVRKRGELMSRVAGGGMAAVIGLYEEQVADVLKRNNLQSIDIANYNSPTQIVITGPKTDIERAKPVFEGMKEVKLFVPLKTSGAFHSRYMKEAKREFESFINTFQFSELAIPVVSNVHARQYKQSIIKQNLLDQITHPVKWTESIRYLMGLGEMEFEEIGPGKVLTGLIQRIKKEAEPLVIESVKTENAPSSKGEKDETKPIQTGSSEILPSSLGSAEFKKDYNLKYAYLTGAMYRGIASIEMVVKIGKAGMMGFLGTGGLKLSEIEDSIQYIQKELSAGQAYGMNLLHNPGDPEMEEKTVDLFSAYGVKNIEAAAFLSITPALVKYRAKGLTRDQHRKIIISNKIIAKASRPEVAEAFLSPAPDRILAKLVAEKKITPEQADLSKGIPLADDICAEADSGGHTDGAMAYALMPAMIKLRDEMMDKHLYQKKVRVGAAGGIGTPEAAAAAFIMGADFILTGSINQCTVEAGTSNAVKDLLQQMNVQDTEYAPAGDMFELGAKVQVLKKGLFFPARANKLYDLYRQFNSLNEIDEKTRTHIQEKYFRCSFEKVYEDVRCYYPAQEIEKAEQNPKHKMALMFRWYFGYTTGLALSGNEECKVDYQVHCGPALGAFNQWVKGTRLENWRNRHVDEIGNKLMIDTATLLNKRFQTFIDKI